MRIITWNVNALRTVLPYRPWNELQDKSIGGMLAAMDAEIICFQEHKGRRDQMNKGMATLPNFDAFFSFPYGKGGYSGTCVYTRSEYVVPRKAEEGITGLLLDGSSSCVLGSTNRAGMSREHRIGCYADEDDIKIVDEIDGGHFDLKSLDMEGRAVVLDFGLFVLFNLYCPNETNDTRLPYKLNYLYMLQARIARLMAAGRQVIVVGDINVCHRPIDNGEGGIQRAANEHFEHPARRWFDAWVRDEERDTGILVDVTRRSWPKRKGMFTCWNQKLDARPSNYGARIDYILVSPGLLPWVKESDIQPGVMGSDHCPVYVDLHETIPDPKQPGQQLVLRDLLNEEPRIPLPPATQAVADPLRTLPQPPPFATCFWDEFSAKQRNLNHFFGKKGRPAQPLIPAKRARERSSDAAPPMQTTSLSPKKQPLSTLPQGDKEVTSAAKTFAINGLATPPVIDISDGEERPAKRPSMTKVRSSSAGTLASGKKGPAKASAKAAQAGIKSFFTRNPGRSGSPDERQQNDSAGVKQASQESTESAMPSGLPHDVDADFLYAKSLAEAEEPDDRLAAGQGAEEDRAEVAGTWSNIFAKKVPPKCIIHGEICKPYTSKVTTSKGRKFWLCSRPVGPGYDSGRSKRPRNEVNHDWRCDFFLWDSALKTKEQQSPSAAAKR